ncbi:MAG TPA: N-formylglutamate amidohydrolase [Gammaproteobacteria bacterium]|nr:N-formylglutamate amidohydrolase [Gammaproteobacteria bacterium]
MQPFIVREAQGEETPVVVSIPHAGTHLPEEIAARLASDYMRTLPMTDWHVHDLYDFLPSLGVTVIYATWSRFYVDLNRAPENTPLYPGRFETGLVPLETFDGERIWTIPPDAHEIDTRRERVHAPYHAKLAELLESKKSRFGRAYLIDAHSVASRANRLHGELVDHVFLGNRDGATCDEWMIDLFDMAFTERGYAVARNYPYKGGFITDHYGRLPGVRALQIEMAQRVYMDENDPARALQHPNFMKAKHDIRGVFVDFLDWLHNIRDVR